MKTPTTLLLLFLSINLFSQCDVSVEIISVGEFNFPNWEYLDPYCEDNYTGTNYIDIVFEICATDTSCAPVSIWSGIESLNTGATSSWSQFPCRSIMRTNIDQPTQTGITQIVACISNWSFTDYSPFIDDDMSNNCDTVYVDIGYCEDGCDGDVCDEPIFLNLGQYDWYDNTQCIDEFGNEILEDDECEISVENDMYFVFSTLSDSICLFVETIDTTNLDLALQIQIWEVENSDYCDAIVEPPLYDACAYGGSTINSAEFITLTDSVDIGVGQFIMVIDGLNGDETEFYLGVEQCSEPIILSHIEFNISSYEGFPRFHVESTEDYDIFRSSNLDTWTNIGNIDIDRDIKNGVYYYQVRSGSSISLTKAFKRISEKTQDGFIFCNNTHYYIENNKCYNKIGQEITCPCE